MSEAEDTKKDEQLDKLLDSTLEHFDKKRHKKSKNKQNHEEKSQELDMLALFGKAGFPETASLQDLNNQLLNLSMMGQKSASDVITLPGTSSGSSSSIIVPSLSPAPVTAELPSLSNTDTATSNIGNGLHEAILKLSQDSEKLKELPTEAEMEEMFSGVSAENIEKDLGNLLPMMEGMMQSLLSKELLYPAIKDMNSQFPAWLDDNKDKISADDHAKFTKQFQITSKICSQFESEDASNEESKKASFDKVLTLMEEMQALGHPPKDLVGDSVIPTLPGPFAGASPDHCTIS